MHSVDITAACRPSYIWRDIITLHIYNTKTALHKSYRYTNTAQCKYNTVQALAG